MKVFISWSGETSHLVAKVLRDWIPSMIQAVKPYVSSEDIDKGSRWSSDIAAELDTSSYGIICLTKSNISAPWINFEAGALGKSVDKSNVSPFLFRINPSDINGPLIQYQSTRYDKNDILKLMQSINLCCGEQALEVDRLKQIFEVWWPKLEESLNGIPLEAVPESGKKETPESRSSDIEKFSEILEELLDMSRGNYKLLRDPETILPKDYLQYALNVDQSESDLLSAIRATHSRFVKLLNLSKEADFISPEVLRDNLSEIYEPLEYAYSKYASNKIKKTNSRKLTLF